MKEFINKVQNIRDKIANINSVLDNLCVKNLYALPNIIRCLSFNSKNKVSAFLTGTLTSLDESDFVGVTSIKAQQFKDLTSLQSVSLPVEINNISTEAFINCINLSQVILPRELRDISTGVFENCTSLTSIELPESMILINERAFSGCSNLTDIYLNSHSCRIAGTSAIPLTTVIHVPIGSGESYRSHAVWSLYTIVEDL